MLKLLPVTSWNFRLYKVTYRNTEINAKKELWCVSTDVHLDDEAQRRWPSDYYDIYEVEDMGEAARPPQVGSIYDLRIDENAWAYGERLRVMKGL